MTIIRLAALAVLAAGATLGGTAPARAQEASIYSTPGKWTVTRYRVNGKVSFCDAIYPTGGGNGLYFSFSEYTATIGFAEVGSAVEPAPINVQMWFNKRTNEAQTYEMHLEPDPAMRGFEWRSLTHGNDEPWGELDSFQNTDTVNFSYPDEGKMHVATFALSGSNQAIKDTIDCVYKAN